MLLFLFPLLQVNHKNILNLYSQNFPENREPPPRGLKRIKRKKNGNESAKFGVKDSAKKGGEIDPEIWQKNAPKKNRRKWGVLGTEKWGVFFAILGVKNG